MIAIARRIDPAGDYRLIRDGDLTQFKPAAYSLVLCAFSFDNIAGAEKKIALLQGLGKLLDDGGRIVSLVSSPEIYVNESASFSTRDFPEN